ncbi:hypothetical protein B932_1606 [Gluconobacter oxydans H24]|nr:hypothetical protein B932_1606 [Gluconobacter oxydans H24]
MREAAIAAENAGAKAIAQLAEPRTATQEYEVLHLSASCSVASRLPQERHHEASGHLFEDVFSDSRLGTKHLASGLSG